MIGEKVLATIETEMEERDLINGEIDSETFIELSEIVSDKIYEYY